MLEVKAAIKNRNYDIKIELYDNHKLIYEVDYKELRTKTHEAIQKELMRRENLILKN